MSSRTGSAVVALASLLALGACGGAKAPEVCPAGTTLKGSDCVATEPSDDDSTPSGGGSSGKGDDSSGSSGSSGGASAGGDSGGDTGKVAYDKDAVDIEIKRAIRQVKGHCGSATDTEGQATGPWGTAKVNVTIGRNGHVKQVTVPSPYDGKPVGKCVVQAFQKIQFPPYAGSADAAIDVDVELVSPKK